MNAAQQSCNQNEENNNREIGSIRENRGFSMAAQQICAAGTKLHG
jgi:hypothetical protein